MPFHVLALTGSLRSGSSNTGLIMMAKRLAPSGLQVEFYPDIAHLPFYTADLDQPGEEPESVVASRAAVRDTDAVLVRVPDTDAVGDPECVADVVPDAEPLLVPVAQSDALADPERETDTVAQPLADAVAEPHVVPLPDGDDECDG
ncbi:MAG: NAD(P)H-dependent oxidoreductase, partial [Actinomycetota bacterium]